MIEENDLISIIIPVYNVEDYVSQCIESVLNQTYKKLEIILVDDGSTDKSGNICDKYGKKDNRIKIIHKKNGGASSARNAGLHIATGDYIGFVDSDDWIDNDMYENLYKAIRENNVLLSMCLVRWVDGGNIKEDKLGYTKVYDAVRAFEKLIDNEPGYNIAVWNKLYSRSLVYNMKFPEGHKYEDIMYTAKAVYYAGNSVCVGYPKYNYRVIRQGSLMNEGFQVASITDELYFYQKRLAFVQRKMPELTEKAAIKYCQLHRWHMEKMVKKESFDYDKLFWNNLMLKYRESYKLIPLSKKTLKRKIIGFMFSHFFRLYVVFMRMKRIFV